MDAENLYIKAIEYTDKIYTLLFQKVSNEFINDTYRHNVAKRIYRYAMPVVELSNNKVEEIDLYIQSLIIAYTVYLDLFLDEVKNIELYTITNLIYSEIIFLITKHHSDIQSKLFIEYSYKNNVYLEIEKNWDKSVEYSKRYLGENRMHKAIIVLYVPNELMDDDNIGIVLHDYVNYMLFIDDVIDYYSDINNKTLTYVNMKYGISANIDKQIFYDEYSYLSSKLNNVSSIIIQDVKKEMEYGIKRKRIFDRSI